jgi:hypothetical protein
MHKPDLIIIGGGAAGLMCAFTAGQRGRRVLVLERNAEVGAKILISGGGRCNFTNRDIAPERFVSGNPHFARSALSRYTQHDFIALVEKHRIAWYEKALGQLFCEGDRSARKIVRMLLDECAAAHVDIRTRIEIGAVRKAEHYIVETNAGAFEAPALALAAGGLSIPKLGATDLAHRIARQFGLPIAPPRPGLVPLTLDSHDATLAGLSAPVVARADGPAFREAALFTHRGLSGPAILQASNYWRPGEALTIDWAPDHTADALAHIKRERPKALVRTGLAAFFPERLAAHFARGAPDGALGDIKDQTLAALMHSLKDWRVAPSGTEGYAKAEVTLGGVDVNALSQQTMEAKAAPGLFVIGEAADVTGWLGGYNFQWAWSSGWAAGKAV